MSAVTLRQQGAFRRLVALLIVTFALVLIANTSVFNLLGSLRGWVSYAAILLTTLAAIWKARLLPSMTVRSKLAVAETLIVVCVLIIYLAFNGTECRLPTLCISAGDSWGVVSLEAFIVAIGSNLLVSTTEELLFRGYLIHEITDNLGLEGLRTTSGRSFPVQAICISAALFALWHVPHYGSLTSGTPFFENLGEALAAGIMFGLVYWWTDWNLAVPIISHFSFDAFGVVGPLASSNPSTPLLTLVVFPVLAILVHTAAPRRASKERTSQSD